MGPLVGDVPPRKIHETILKHCERNKINTGEGGYW